MHGNYGLNAQVAISFPRAEHTIGTFVVFWVGSVAHPLLLDLLPHHQL